MNEFIVHVKVTLEAGPTLEALLRGLTGAKSTQEKPAGVMHTAAIADAAPTMRKAAQEGAAPQRKQAAKDAAPAAAEAAKPKPETTEKPETETTEKPKPETTEKPKPETAEKPETAVTTPEQPKEQKAPGATPEKKGPGMAAIREAIRRKRVELGDGGLDDPKHHEITQAVKELAEGIGGPGASPYDIVAKGPEAAEELIQKIGEITLNPEGKPEPIPF